MLTPMILHGPYGQDAIAASEIITLPLAATQDGHAEIGIGSWLTDEASKGLRATKDADDAVAYVVDGILLADGVTPKKNAYLTATEAGSGNYKLRVIPIGGLTFMIGEDGVGGNIADSDLATKIYYDIVVGTIGDTGEAEKTASGDAAAHANIKIDSSSGATATTGKLIEVQRIPSLSAALVGSSGSAYSTGTGRAFRAKVISTAATKTQA